MIRMFSRVAARGLGVSFEARGGCEDGLEEVGVCRPSASVSNARGMTQPLSVEALCALLPAARRVAAACGSTLRAVHATLHEDLENAAPFFAELNFEGAPPEENDASDDEAVAAAPGAEGDSLQGLATRYKTHTVANGLHSRADNEPLVIRSSDPAVPTIIITPCGPQPRESSCWVPYQDACFGNRLVVPAHPVVNEVFPPLLPKPLPCPRRWEYAGGHWRAVLPTVDEQVRRGLFSRALTGRRRSRHCR